MSAPQKKLLQQAMRDVRRHRLDAAEAVTRRILASEPASIEALNLLATILIYRGDAHLDDAESVLRQVEQLDPDCASLPNNYGTLAWARGDFQSAESCFQQAVVREPDSARPRVNLAHCLRRLGKAEEAIAQYHRAIEIDTGVPPPVYASLASTCEYLGRYDEALHHYSRAISLRPDFSRARYARGMLLLKLGRFDAGWRDYEWRFEATGHDYLDGGDWNKPLWNGEPFDGRRVVAYHEQGFGDAIHFIRYLPWVKRLGGEVVLKCGSPLFRLALMMDCVDGVIARRTRLWEDDLEFDYHVPLMSLPRIFGTRLDSIPADIPYLGADPKDVERWAGTFDQRMLNVGLAWSGRENQARNHERSCRLADLIPLGDISGVCFYSLQKDRARLQIAEVADSLRVIDDRTSELYDFAETAAFMENLDLIITVDTVTAHLAGALGRPTWTLLCKTHCWRYLLEREDSPWYPTMTLFRQQSHGDWSAPVAEVRRRLVLLAKRKRTQHSPGSDGEAISIERRASASQGNRSTP